MGKLFLPRHGHTHCPGGSDPLPCSTDSVWAALYAGATVWGQPIMSSGVSLELHFPAHDQSDGSSSLFTFAEYPDPDDIMPQHYRVTLNESGLYTFHLNAFWVGPEVPEMRNGYSVGRVSGGIAHTPGDINQPFVSFGIWASHYHNLGNFSDWEHTNHTTWTLPVLITDPVEIGAFVAHEGADITGNTVGEESLVDARFIITYHGPIMHAEESFLAQDGG